jgi:hypothetical protein
MKPVFNSDFNSPDHCLQSLSYTRRQRADDPGGAVPLFNRLGADAIQLSIPLENDKISAMFADTFEVGK